MQATARPLCVGYYYDGKPMYMGNAIHVANPTDKHFTQHRYLLNFGQVGTSFVLTYSDSLEDALEIAAEFMLDLGWIGFVISHDRLQEDLGCDCADPFECEAHTYTEAGWLDSGEWGVQEDPSNAELKEVHRAGH